MTKGAIDRTSRNKTSNPTASIIRRKEAEESDKGEVKGKQNDESVRACVVGRKAEKTGPKETELNVLRSTSRGKRKRAGLESKRMNEKKPKLAVDQHMKGDARTESERRYEGGNDGIENRHEGGDETEDDPIVEAEECITSNRRRMQSNFQMRSLRSASGGKDKGRMEIGVKMGKKRREVKTVRTRLLEHMMSKRGENSQKAPRVLTAQSNPREALNSSPDELSDDDRVGVVTRMDSRPTDIEARLKLDSDTESEFEESVISSSDESYTPKPTIKGARASRSGAPEKADHGDSRKRQYRYITRKRYEKKDSDLFKRRAEDVQGTETLEFNKWQCCRKLKCFESMDLNYFRSQRKKLLTSSQSERKEALASMLGEDGKFSFNRNVVCATFLEHGFRFSRDLQSAVKGTPNAKTTRSPTRGQKDNKSSSQRDRVVSFLTTLANATADEMPNSRERHLPYHQKKEVYSLLRETMKTWRISGAKVRPPTLPYFVRTWNSYVPHIKVRKIRPFAKCQTCEEARQALADAKGNKEKCAAIMERRRAHHKVVTLERASYLSRATRAVEEPDKCWSIAIDGADQSRFGLPHFVVSSTKQTRGHSIKVKLVGLLQHGAECKCFLYTMTAQFETGANHVIEVIHRWMIRKQRSETFPDILYIQTDNTTRENKNRYLMGYLECLVAWGVFKEIQISFLPVGHTHIDIDQRFSCTSRKLKSNNAVSMKELHANLRNSMTPKPSTTALDHVANISGLLDKSDSLRSVPPFSRYRFFRFTRVAGRPSGGTGRFRTTCRVKMSCNSEWDRLFETEPSWGFVKAAPDLHETPDTELRSPDDKEDVIKRIESEYIRINDEGKRDSLLELMRSVYQTKRDKFHWNVERSPEMNGRHYYGRASVSDRAVPEEDLDTYEPRTRVHYDVNSFVAVRPHVITEECPFWIAQVLQNIRNVHGVVYKVKIQWYEVKTGMDVYRGKYEVSELLLSNGKREVWVAEISTDAIFYNFAKFNVKNELSSDDARKIEEEVEKRWLQTDENSRSGSASED